MQRIFYLFFIIFLLHGFAQCIKFRNKPRYCRNKVWNSLDERNDIALEDEAKLEECDCNFYDPGEISTHLPQDQCSFDLKMNRAVINPFARSEECDKEDQDSITLKSACVKCAACLAIAENVNRTITDIYYEKQAVELQTNNSHVYQALENLCTSGFKNYDLREYNGNVLIMKATAHNNHVSSRMNGKWTKILRELCKNYVRHMDVEDILQRYKYGTIRFIDYTCKGDGVFRDCQNIKFKQTELPSTTEGEGDMNFQISIDCM